MTTESNSYKIDIELIDILGEKKRFTTFGTFVSFFEKENDFWRVEVGNIASREPFNDLLHVIGTALNEINSYKNNFSQWDESTKQQRWNQLFSRVQQLSTQIVFSQTPFAIALVEACKIGQMQAHAFWAVVTNKNNNQLPNITVPYLEGAFLGYEFLYQDESVIYKRRDSERHAFSSLRKTLSDQTDVIVGQIDDFKSQIDEWKTTSQEELATDREAYKNEQSEFLSSSAEKLETQLAKDKDDRELFFADAMKRIENLEALYREKLRLEPAATYWNNRAKKLRDAGRGWGALLAVTTIVTGLGFGWLFQQWMTSSKVIETFTAMHWQGVVLLVATLTMFIFLIRVLGKMTFSSFHLQRDAEERELLSYLYLALSEKGNVDSESRQVVLQSLFSRAETGLLSGDHGPTIPVAEVAQKIRSN